MASDVWSGRTVVCIASGPSLTGSDCELVRKSGHPVIAVNNSWKLAPFAQVIYAADAIWWASYANQIDVAAERWTCAENIPEKFKTQRHGRFNTSSNSGLRAIQFAIWRGASKVILLGYDCSVENGFHWHGAHEKTGNPDAAKCKKWKKAFAELSIGNCEVINCSRESALECFPRCDIESALL